MPYKWAKSSLHFYSLSHKLYPICHKTHLAKYIQKGTAFQKYPEQYQKSTFIHPTSFSHMIIVVVSFIVSLFSLLPPRL